ncbi:MAG: hypothetical protein ACRDNR_16335, partial [Gaiellaceae bacterium]
MDTGAIVAVAIGAVVLIALVALAMRAMRSRRLETRRMEAGELRREARQHSLRADKESALAQEQEANARRLKAEAD